MHDFWLWWIAAFLVVVGVLAIACAIHEWWLWRKDRD
jgi:hypothetical protein